ncbi:sigma-70 family RNA polymerase sigma factor [Bacteroides sp.]
MDKTVLVNLCKKGDEQALNLLYNTYSGKMMKICLRYVSDKQIAQDLLHDGFIVILSSIGSLRNPERLESWMGVVIKNTALHYLNQSNATYTIPLSEISEEDEPVENPFMTEFISYDRMMELVERLPEGYSKVFKLAVLEGLSHKEIGDLLNIAPHSSSSQLYRAKALLRKMIANYRLILILLLLFLIPLFDNHVYWKRQSYLSKITIRQAKAERRQESKQTDSPEQVTSHPRETVRHREEERLQLPELAIAPPPMYTEKTPSNLPAREVTINMPRAAKPPIVLETPDATLSCSYPIEKPVFQQRNKKAGKWKLMLAGSLGPQLAQSLYKLIVLPEYNNGTSAVFPQEVSTWEEYYTYLNTRYQEGTLGDSITLIEIAENNKGKIVEHQHHDSPITIGLSINKKLNKRWSLETGLQYTLLKSTFSTGEKNYIQETQKIHYIGIPIRASYRWGNFRKLSFYSTAGIQADIPLKGTLHTSSHFGDSVSVNIDSRSLDVPLQWSINASTGVQYHFTPHASFYIEPTLNYYIPDGSGLRTIRREHPVTFTIPLGLRFSW